jgi:hypothetical protein
MTTTERTTAREAFDEITAFEDELQALITNDEAPTGATSLKERTAETRDRLLALSQEGIQLELDDELKTELFAYCLSTLHKLTEASGAAEDSEAGRQKVAEALVDLEALRHILRDGIDHEPLRTLDTGSRHVLSRADAARHVAEWLPRLNVDDQAVLLGLDPRGLRRWRGDEQTPATRHAELAVELAGILRHSWTDEGVLRWFSRSHPLLEGHAPNDVLDDPDWERRLRDAARAARAQTAT